MKQDRRVRWHPQRTARFGVLVALGWTPDQIAHDDQIATTPDAVRRQASRLGLEFRDRPFVGPSPMVLGVFAEASEKYEGMSGPRLMNTVLRILASQPQLLHDVCQKGGIR